MSASGSAPDGVELGALRRVRLVEFPLRVYARAQEHHEELMREFALIANPHPDSADEIPERLLDVVAAMRARYAAFTAGPDAERQAAIERGDETMDLEFLIPEAARDACLDLSALLDQVDDYCRTGQLLTMASPPELLAFRRWYLGEFVAQLDGAEPTPWSAHDPAGASL